MATRKRKYTIELIESKEGNTLNRINDGFSLFELIGILEMAKSDLIEQFKDFQEEKIDIVKRKVVK